MAEQDDELNESLSGEEVSKENAASGEAKLKWYKRLRKGITTSTAEKREMPEGLWSKCESCEAVLYRSDLEKLEKSLLWASDNGRSQREAYDKVDKKQKERADLIDAARNAFIFTYMGHEKRADRVLVKFRMEPNPSFKATNRATSIFAKVRGFVWVDELAAQLARAEIEVTEDISIGGFLAKIYKGSHLMQERYEMAPGVWFPSYAQYDFDGRRLFVSFAIHERTFYSQYRYVGPPKEALVTIRAELGKLRANVAEP